ncbi:Protein CBR-IGCM-3 [Caenorhabditis briggsae]|uniref:Protein CBR-IGCM-3 n=1 Tax=Caenorhabditis briggsae TaxID=6238 RepID=A8WRW8_CAEBR|nr:Protein CBR-IGCM-3 [Caenorhabditis briggsae]CAP23226.2 Protein CBR-IGCM-3 [Caenorhabditis briggsae]
MGLPIVTLLTLLGLSSAQMMSQVMVAQVKITDAPYPVSNAEQLNQVVWTVHGTPTKEAIFCVSEAPVSQLRFVCTDCMEKNITDMVNVLNSAQDITRRVGFPAVTLRDINVNTNWSGATIICQAALNGGTVDSAPSAVEVRYLRQPHVVDSNGQSPVLIGNQGYRFFVECVRNAEGICQQSGRRKTLKCNVQSNPPATQYRWLKNGSPSGTGAEITIGTEMIGQSIQCQANNGLHDESNMPLSQAVQIDPYSSAKLLKDNFQQLQSSSPFLANNRIEMNQQVNLGCQVEGNPRPIVYWRMRKQNGDVVDAACPQGLEGQYQEMAPEGARSANIVRLTALCSLRISNYSYSGQYWCAACSQVSQGEPECSPSLETPGTSSLNVQVIGAPSNSDAPPSIEQRGPDATVLVHYCAEPMPRPPREIVFSIDQNDLQRKMSKDFNNNFSNSRLANHGRTSTSTRLSPTTPYPTATLLVSQFHQSAKRTNTVKSRSNSKTSSDLNRGKDHPDYNEPKSKANFQCVFLLFCSIFCFLSYQTLQKKRATVAAFHEGVNYAELELKRSHAQPTTSTISLSSVHSRPHRGGSASVQSSV